MKIPVNGPGSKRIVECPECGIKGSISTKWRKSSSGFLFVCGQHHNDNRKIWKRYENNLCYDCNFLTIEVVEDEM